MKVRIVDSGKKSAGELMARDRSLLNLLGPGEVVLHLYEWRSSFPLTYGHFMQPERFLVPEHHSLGMDVAVRPTGGGFIFHHGDYAFSLLMSSHHHRYAPRVLDSYHVVNQMVLHILLELFQLDAVLAEDDKEGHPRAANFCMAKASIYDVLVQGRKVGGAAQRRVKQGFLHQGSIFLSGNSPEIYERFLLPEVGKVAALEVRNNAFFPLGISASPSILQEVRTELKYRLIQKVSAGEL